MADEKLNRRPDGILQDSNRIEQYPENNGRATPFSSPWSVLMHAPCPQIPMDPWKPVALQLCASVMDFCQADHLSVQSQHPTAHQDLFPMVPMGALSSFGPFLFHNELFFLCDCSWSCFF